MSANFYDKIHNFQKKIIGNNCFNVSLNEICKFLDINNRFIFLTIWTFEYNLECEKIYEKLLPTMTNTNCYEYFGIKMTLSAHKKDALNSIINEVNSNEKICLAKVDAYYCNWNKAYGKEHLPHYFIIFDIDYKYEKILCRDPYISNDKIFEVNFNKVEQLVKGVLYCTRTEVLQSFEFVDYIINCMLYYNPSLDMIEQYYDEFIGDLKSSKSTDDIFNSKNDSLNIICIELSQLVAKRRCIVDILGNNKRIELQAIKYSMNSSYYLWTQINLIVLKMSVTRTGLHKNVNVICKYLEKIKELDKKILESLIRQKKGNNVEEI